MQTLTHHSSIPELYPLRMARLEKGADHDSLEVCSRRIAFQPHNIQLIHDVKKIRKKIKKKNTKPKKKDEMFMPQSMALLLYG